MRTYEESLARVLDPEHYLCLMIKGGPRDEGRERLIEMRLDFPQNSVDAAGKQMQAAGWHLASRPDEGVDAIERVFWRRTTAHRSENITSLLTAALRVTHDHDGTLMSWVDVEELGEG